MSMFDKKIFWDWWILLCMIGSGRFGFTCSFNTSLEICPLTRLDLNLLSNGEKNLDPHLDLAL